MVKVVLESVGLSVMISVELHQGSMSLLFIIVLEALSREVRSGCPEELLYVDDFALAKLLSARQGD